MEAVKVPFEEAPDNALSKEARDALVVSHERLVHRLARNMTSDPDLKAEMVGEGFLVLMKAARKFDASKGVFFGYAKQCLIWSNKAVLRNHLNKRGGMRGLAKDDVKPDRFSFEEVMEQGREDDTDRADDIEFARAETDLLIAKAGGSKERERALKVAILSVSYGLTYDSLANRLEVSSSKINDLVGEGLILLREAAKNESEPRATVQVCEAGGRQQVPGEDLDRQPNVPSEFRALRLGA